MVNKREGYKRVANIFSCLGAAWVIGAFLVTVVVQTLGVDGFVKLRGEYIWLKLSAMTVVSTVVLYYVPQLLHKAGCYIADGFKPTE